MGTFYRDKTRDFNKNSLVLCQFVHLFKGEYVHDSIMISVDSSSEIEPEFTRICKLLERKYAKLLSYLPDNGQPTFDYWSNRHAEQT